MSRSDGLALPSANWYAYEGWNGISVNKVAADELEISDGDTLSLSWYSYSDDGELVSDSANVTISSVIAMEGKGSMGGSKSPAIFTSLEYAQILQSKISKVNMIRVSLDNDVGATESLDEIESILDGLIDSQASGFEINTDGDAMSISNSNGLGRLDTEFMESWSENKSERLVKVTRLRYSKFQFIKFSKGIRY